MDISETRDTRCPVCEKDNTREEYRTPSFSIYYCPECDIEFNADFPPKGSIREAFSREYYLELQKEAFAVQETDHSLDPMIKFYKEGLARMDDLAGGKKLLDVGAGMGAFLKTAHDDGWDVEGIEISPFGSKFINEKYGFTIYDRSITALDLGKETYDAITFWDVIEHVEYPKRQLLKAHELLKPGGILLLTSDNYRSLLSFTTRLAYGITLGKITYPMERFFTPYNKTYMNYINMERILRETGYEVVFFRKMQYPISKIPLGLLERPLLTLLCGIETLLNLQSQFTFIARKI